MTAAYRAELAEGQGKTQAQNPFNPTVTIGVINANWSKLSDQEKATVGNIKSIDVSGSAQRSYVQESTGKLTLTQDYVSKSSKAWLASAIGHDGEHVALFNSGGIGASRGLPAEVKAMQFQLQVGTKFGLSATETKHMKHFGSLAMVRKLGSDSICFARSHTGVCSATESFLLLQSDLLPNVFRPYELRYPHTRRAISGRVDLPGAVVAVSWVLEICSIVAEPHRASL